MQLLALGGKLAELRFGSPRIGTISRGEDFRTQAFGSAFSNMELVIQINT